MVCYADGIILSGNNNRPVSYKWAGIAQSVQLFATDWTLRESNPSWARLSAPVQTGPGAHPASYTIGIRSFFAGKAAAAWRSTSTRIQRRG